MNWQFKNIITKTINMEDATIQKPWIDTLFRRTKVVKLVSYLKLEFNIDFIHQEVSFCILKDTFLNVKITTVIVGNFETIQSINVTKEKQF